MDPCANSTYNATDPDISGPGVRISFYLQTVLLVLLVDRSWEEAPIALWTFIATSFGLTIAAIIQWDNLTLFQALQVSNLVWMANFGTFIALASYSRQKVASRRTHKSSAAITRDPASVRSSQAEYKEEAKRRRLDYGVKYGAMIQTVFSMALTLFMWSTAETFGPSSVSECSSRIIFAIFVIKAPALGAGRSAGLAISSTLTALYTVITLRELYSHYRTLQGREYKSKTSAEKVLIKSPPSIAAYDTASPASTPARITARVKSFPRYSRPGRRTWASPLDPMLIGISICQVLIFTYFIASIELLIKYNHSTNGRSFGFGQILALVLVLPSFLSVIGAFHEHGLARHTAGKTQRNHPRRRSDAASIV